MQRESWKNRAIFIFAAIGSAVGLGNAWRFPGLCAKYGGGAFLLVYLIAMIIVGWPLLMMEIAIGRHMKKGAISSLRAVNRKTEFVGWAGVINAFFIATYYAVILGWILVMIIKGFSMGGMSATEAGNVFTGSALNYQGLPSSMSQLFSSGSMDIPGAIMIGLIASWVAIYLCIRKGAHSAGKVVPYTVLIPVVLLLILGINGIVRDFNVAGGAGLAKLFTPDFSALKNSGIWTDAFGQVFYSLSVMMAIMIAYGSYVHEKSDIVKDTLIIAVSDMLISILAGIVLFTTLSGTGMLESYLQNVSGGIGTAFIVYPQALVSLTGNAVVNSFFAIVFYLTLLTLAIDSAFSIIEGVSTAISDRFKIKNKTKVTLITCCFAGLISLIFATKSGLDWLDIVDNWCNSYNLIIVGIMECFAVGWLFKVSNVRKELNRSAKNIKIGAWYDWVIRVVAPLILSVLLVWNVVSIIKSYASGAGGYGGYPIYAQLIAGWAVSLVTFGGAIAMQIIARKNAKLNALGKDDLSWEQMERITETDFEKQDELSAKGIKFEDQKAILDSIDDEIVEKVENAEIVESAQQSTKTE